MRQGVGGLVMNEIENSAELPKSDTALLVWTAPVLEPLGSVEDVKAGAAAHPDLLAGAS